MKSCVLHRLPRTAITAKVSLLLCVCGLTVAQQPRIQYYEMAKGFVEEARNSYGWAAGSGFAKQNPWGQYTAFLMMTGYQGQRTWRIEPADGLLAGTITGEPFTSGPDAYWASTTALRRSSLLGVSTGPANPAFPITQFAFPGI